MRDDPDKTEAYHISEVRAAGGLDAFSKKLISGALSKKLYEPAGRPCFSSDAPGCGVKKATSTKPLCPGPSPESEHDAQARLLRHFRSLEDQHPEYVLVFAVPNAGKRKTGGWSVAEGLKAGVPDLCWPLPTTSYHGLYVEMKREDGGAGPAELQSAWLVALHLMGFRTAVCNGYDEALAVFSDHFEGYMAAHDIYDLSARHKACLELAEALRRGWRKNKNKKGL